MMFSRFVQEGSAMLLLFLLDVDLVSITRNDDICAIETRIET